MPSPASPEGTIGQPVSRGVLLRRIRKWRRQPEHSEWLCIEACVFCSDGEYTYEVSHRRQRADSAPVVVRSLSDRRAWPIYAAMLDGFGNGELWGLWESDERIPAHEDPTGLFSAPPPYECTDTHPAARRRRDREDRQT